MDGEKIRGYTVNVSYLTGEVQCANDVFIYFLYISLQDTVKKSWSRENTYFSVIGIKIDLVSRYRKYLFVYFIPTTMFTLTSWVSYLLPPTSYPARTSLLVTVFLCQVGIFTAAIKDTPNYDEGLPNTSGEMILKVDKSNISRNDIPGALVLCLHHLHLRGADELRLHPDQDGMQAAVE